MRLSIYCYTQYIIHEIRDLWAFVDSIFDSIDARVGKLKEGMAYVHRHFPPS